MAKSGNYWNIEEDNNLIKLYNFMDINEIALIFQRTPYAIALRILKKNIVKNMEEVKGHNKNWINPTFLKNKFEKVQEPQKEQYTNSINNKSNVCTMYSSYEIFQLTIQIDKLKERVKFLENNQLNGID
jgi:hypothetical protein